MTIEKVVMFVNATGMRINKWKRILHCAICLQ